MENKISDIFKWVPYKKKKEYSKSINTILHHKILIIKIKNLTVATY